MTNHPNRNNIYDQHAAAFSQVSAYVIAKDGEGVATIAFKHPRAVAGRLYAYVHWLGIQVVRGSATGDGYDKCSAACSSAAEVLDDLLQRIRRGGTYYSAAAAVEATPFCDALREDGGLRWDSRLRCQGFEVWKAV